LVATALVVGAVGGVGVPPVKALPRGCASTTSDYSTTLDPAARQVAVRVNTDQPCTFVFAWGDTFSGSGRFTVSCSSGGYYHHPDFQEGQYPPVAGVPIPQPCEEGATVTLNGYHAATGGTVIGGGLGRAPNLPQERVTDRDVLAGCAKGSSPHANVELMMPIDYSGFLTYRGSVRCDGADIEIIALTITPTAGYRAPSAGAARCKRCRGNVSVSGTYPATAWIYEVEMKFAISVPGQPALAGRRLGRYAVHWGGEVTPICPTDGSDTCPL
jgi:hypothetical protein